MNQSERSCTCIDFISVFMIFRSDFGTVPTRNEEYILNLNQSKSNIFLPKDFLSVHFTKDVKCLPASVVTIFTHENHTFVSVGNVCLICYFLFLPKTINKTNYYHSDICKSQVKVKIRKKRRKKELIWMKHLEKKIITMTR